MGSLGITNGMPEPDDKKKGLNLSLRDVGIIFGVAVGSKLVASILSNELPLSEQVSFVWLAPVIATGVAAAIIVQKRM